MRKNLLIIAIVITIIIVSLNVWFYVINKKMSKQEFISLMRRFEDISNVKIEGNSTKYIKDNYMLAIEKNGIYTWANSEAKECIRYIPSDKKYAYIEYAESDYSELEEAEYTFIRI